MQNLYKTQFYKYTAFKQLPENVNEAFTWLWTETEKLKESVVQWKRELRFVLMGGPDDLLNKQLHVLKIEYALASTIGTVLFENGAYKTFF
jgi:hypothetical protein